MRPGAAVAVGILAVCACGPVVEPTAAGPVAAARVAPTSTTLVRVYDLRPVSVATGVPVEVPVLASPTAGATSPEPPDLRAITIRQVPVQLPPAAAPLAAAPTPTAAPPPPLPPAPVVPATATATRPATPPTAVPPTSAPPAQAQRTPTAAERAYAVQAIDKIDTLGIGIKALTTQATKAGQNPALMADGQWRLETAASLAILKIAGESLRDYREPIPPSLGAVDATMRLVGADAIYLSDKFAAGMDTRDVSRIDNATKAMQRIEGNLTQAHNQLGALGFR